MKSIVKIIGVVLFTVLAFAEQQEPEVVYTNICWRFNPDNLTNIVLTRTLYPINFEVEISLVGTPNWLNVQVIPVSTNQVKHIFVVNKNFRKYPDMSSEFTMNMLAKRNENGHVGDFLEGIESTTMPKDTYGTVVCQWDPGADNIYEDNQTNIFANASFNIPDRTHDTFFTLFGRNYSQVPTDKDYYHLWPKAEGYDVWILNEAGGDSELCLSIVQSNKVKKTVNLKRSPLFYYKALSCTNLNANIPTYAVIEHKLTNSTENVRYKIAYYKNKTIQEKEIWSDDSDNDILLPGKCLVFNFMAINHDMVVEFYIKDSEQSNWDVIGRDICDKSLNSITQINACRTSGTIANGSFPKSSDEGFFERITLNHLQLSNQYYCVIADQNHQLDGSVKIYARISRIKPVVLVHGIDAGPKFPTDGSTFFGSLKTSIQYFNFRPYSCNDFIWDSTISPGIRKLYIGFGSNGLGKFLKDKKNDCDLKATIVAHSMGCLLTYYQNKADSVSFKKYVNNILLVAPPYFGSSTANTASLPVASLFACYFKRTCQENFDLLSRGTENIWYRHNNPFVFNGTNITVAIGTDKYISSLDGVVSTVDSVNKIDEFDLQKIYDAIIDIPIDGVEALLERLVGHASKIMLNPATTSELYHKNTSDSAVGTYSANLKAQNYYKNISTYYDKKLHSKLQKFEISNTNFVNAVKVKINSIGD